VGTVAHRPSPLRVPVPLSVPVAGRRNCPLRSHLRSLHRKGRRPKTTSVRLRPSKSPKLLLLAGNIVRVKGVAIVELAKAADMRHLSEFVRNAPQSGHFMPCRACFSSLRKSERRRSIAQVLFTTNEDLSKPENAAVEASSKLGVPSKKSLEMGSMRFRRPKTQRLRF
jgi:hypothetical protein